jgi:hypothetical protein
VQHAVRATIDSLTYLASVLRHPQVRELSTVLRSIGSRDQRSVAVCRIDRREAQAGTSRAATYDERPYSELSLSRSALTELAPSHPGELCTVSH